MRIGRIKCAMCVEWNVWVYRVVREEPSVFIEHEPAELPSLHHIRPLTQGALHRSRRSECVRELLLLLPSRVLCVLDTLDPTQNIRGLKYRGAHGARPRCPS